MVYVMSNRCLKLGGFELFGIFGYYEVVDDILDVAVDKCLQIIYGVVDAVISDAPLGIIIGAYLGRAVAC